ncbi:hypothetical protein L798_13287 [Zootermopsis nevadensis]|uniref:Endonuclease-reverse transcriptase n=1 Tax=Zootermopsis nevadensis TaxID=136037 RepID=A0A067R0T6_ZOONE|nr:hypothetical protein L798_13287 [Zootermopsis nevadensis]
MPRKHRLKWRVFERVRAFKNLGSVLTEDNISEEVKHRINVENRSYFGLRLQHIKQETKIKLYKQLIRPILTSGCESWAFNKGNQNLLGGFKRKILRRTYGPTHENGCWRARYELYRNVDVMKEIKLARPRCLGHLYRMPHNSASKKLTFTTPDGRRKLRRPSLWWLDRIEQDFKSLGIRSWRRKASDR